MPRSFFQRPRGTIAPRTGFAGRYDPDFEEDDWPPRWRNVDFEQRVGKKDWWSRLPWLVKAIAVLFMITLGVIAGVVAWLIVGALSI